MAAGSAGNLLALQGAHIYFGVLSMRAPSLNMKNKGGNLSRSPKPGEATEGD